MAANPKPPALPDRSPLSFTQQQDLPARRPLLTETPRGRGDTDNDHETPDRGLDLKAGDVLADRYEFRRTLGSGGMGVVFAAFDRVRKEEVAIKVLLPRLLADPRARERFVQEAKLTSRLSHPHLVRVFDISQTAELTFLTMELLQGKSLREEIHRRGTQQERFTPNEVRQIGEQLCQALHYAHQQQVLHRDVKPENIWLCEDGEVKVMDFGIARLMKPGEFSTRGLSLGTAYYMAPEQLKGQQEIDHRADEYAVGVVLYELLTGEIPQGAIQAPHQARPSVPQNLSQAVMRALAGPPDKRFSDMEQFRKGLGDRKHSVLRLPRWGMVAAAALVVVGCLAASPFVWNHYQQQAAARQAQVDAKAQYTSMLGEVETLQHTAEKIGEEIQGRAKDKQGEVEKWEEKLHASQGAGKSEEAAYAQQRLSEVQPAQKIASQVAELWERHPDFQGKNKGWYAKGTGHLKGAQELAKDNDHVKALAELEKAAQLLNGPQQWQAHAQTALKLVQTTRPGLEKRLQNLKGHPDILYDWPKALLTGVPEKLLKGDGSEALEDAQRAAAALPEIENLLPLRTEVLAAGKEAEICRQDETLLVRHDELQKDVTQADDLVAAGRLEDARSKYQTIRTCWSELRNQLTDRVAQLMQVAEQQRQTKNFNGALDCFSAAIKLDPTLAAAYVGRAGGYVQRKEFDLAIGDYERAKQLDQRLSLNAEIASAYSKRGDEFHERQDYDTAIADFNKAIELDPKVARAYIARGNTNNWKREYSKAIADFDRAIEIDPTSSLAYRWRGVAYDRKDDYERAVADFDKSIELDPKNCCTYTDRGDTYLVTREYAKAIADFNKAIEIHPKCSRAYDGRGKFYDSTNEFDKSIEEFSRAIELETHPTILASYVKHRADVYQKIGKK